MDYAQPELADALAAQYVAGTLRGAARRRFESLLPGHPALRQAVAQWRARLMPLTAAVQAEAPPARAWAMIEQRLWPTLAAEPAQPWWRGLAFWRGASGFATVAALGLGLLLTNPQPQLAPVLVVLQATEAGATPGMVASSFVASFGGDGRSLVTRPIQPVALAAGRALELWAVPPNGSHSIKLTGEDYDHSVSAAATATYVFVGFTTGWPTAGRSSALIKVWPC